MRFTVQVEVSSRGLIHDVEHGIRDILTEHNYKPRNIKVKYVPGDLELKDLNPALIRRSTGEETYRVVIPGLHKDGREVSLPMTEDDVDLELLAHILDHNDW